MAKNRDRREARKEVIASAKRRMAEHKSGGDRLAIRIPAGVSQFKPDKEGNYTFDVIPFTAGKGNPHAAAGEPYWERTYFVHPYLGVNKEAVFCNAMNFKKKCFVCDQRMKLMANAGPNADDDTKKMLADLNPKERQIFLVWDHENKKKKVQVFEFSYHMFGKNLDIRINSPKDPKKKERYQQFSRTGKLGYTLSCTAVQKSMPSGGKPIEIVQIDFEDREEGLPDEIIDHGIDVDGMVRLEDNDKVKEIMLGGDVEEEKPAKKGKKPADDDDDEEPDSELEDEEDDDEEADEEEDEGEEEDDEDDEGEDDEGEEEEVLDEDAVGVKDFVKWKGYKGKPRKGRVVKVKGDTAHVKVKDEEKLHAVPVDDLTVIKKAEPEPEDEEEEDEAPPPKKKAGKKPKADIEDEEENDWAAWDDENDDDEEEDDDDEKPRKKKAKK